MITASWKKTILFQDQQIHIFFDIAPATIYVDLQAQKHWISLKTDFSEQRADIAILFSYKLQVT